MLSIAILTPWKLAMLAIVPLMALPAFDAQKVRTWAAMMAGSIATLLLPDMPYAATVKAYVVIDLAVGWAILRHPSGVAQRAIGCLSGVMAIMGVGYVLSVMAGGGNPLRYHELMMSLSWMRWFVLLSWGLGDAVGLLVHYWRADRGAAAVRGGRR